MKKSIMVEYALKQIGKPYKLGTRGPDKFDCSGLVLQAVAQIGLDFYHGATTQWNRGKQKKEPSNMYGYFKETGVISELPIDKIAILYNRNTAKKNFTMAHTGLYDGCGWVVQAGGYGGIGVHYDPIDRRRWSHYGILLDSWMEFDEKGDNKMRALLKRGSFGQEVKLLQEALIKAGYDVGKWKADGKLGAATERAIKMFQSNMGINPDGIVGPKTWAVLKEISSEKESDDTQTEEMVPIPLRLIKELAQYVKV